MRNYLYPAPSRTDLPKALRLALLGALIAGTFGILHDQITYTISPEYFTRMKFDQFKVWDFGFPPRVFVGEIGFLATWWVGLITAWFLARIAIPKFELPARVVLRSMLALVAFVICLGILAYFLGPSMLENRPGWRESLECMGVTDSVAFQRVAAIHLAGYSGALIGWIVCMGCFFFRSKSRIFPQE